MAWFPVGVGILGGVARAALNIRAITRHPVVSRERWGDGVNGCGLGAAFRWCRSFLAQHSRGHASSGGVARSSLNRRLQAVIPAG